jgi:iron donor protein CyaY
MTEMTENEFRQVVDQALTSLFEQIDEIDSDDHDPNFAAGVLKVEFESGRTYVLSQQVPVQELWLSARLKAWHFKLVDGQWIERDSSEPMLPVLNELFSTELGLNVALSL